MGRWLLGAVLVIFTVTGVVMTIGGQGSDRVVGVAVVLAFGFGGLAFPALKLRRGGGAVELTQVHQQGVPVDAIMIPGSKARSAAFALGAAGLGSSMLLLGFKPEAFAEPGTEVLFVRFVGLGGGCLFLVGALVLAVDAASGRSRMMLSPGGFEMTNPFGRSVVPWDVIEEVGIYEMTVGGNLQRFAAVNTINPERIASSRWWGWLRAPNRKMSGWDLTYPVTSVDISADDLAKIIAAFAAQPSLWDRVPQLPDGEYTLDELLLRLGASDSALETPTQLR